MGEEQTTTKPSTPLSIFAISTILIAPLLFGLIIGSTGPSIDTMKNEIRNQDDNIIKLDTPSKYVVFTAGEASIFSSLVTIGAMLGALVSGRIADSVGFKKTLLLTVPLYIISSVVMYYASRPAILFVARTLTGIAVGVNSFVAPTYIADLSPTNLRGLFGAANQLFITLGIFAVYFIGIYFKIEGGKVYQAADGAEIVNLGDPGDAGDLKAAFCDWRTIAFLNSIPAFVMGICAFFIPESPSWLASKTSGALMSLRPSDPKTAPARPRVKRTENGSTVDQLWKVKKQLGICVALQFFQQFSGINAMMFFCTSIMRKARVASADKYAASVMLEQVIVTTIAVSLIDIAGRKVLLLIGASVMAAACGILGLYFQLISQNITGILLVLLAGMYSYIAAFSLGVGAIPWLLVGELFPANVRAMGASIATTANWVFAFIVTLSFQSAADCISEQGVMWFFGACCIGLVVFTALVVPETKGKTFEEIQMLFDEGESNASNSKQYIDGGKEERGAENDPLLTQKEKQNTV
jgi:MFS family permease